LYYIGGEELIIGTITHKDNVLFAGNIKTNSLDTTPIQKELLLIDRDLKPLEAVKTFNHPYNGYYGAAPYLLNSELGKYDTH
jgi:hypothetical protein